MTAFDWAALLPLAERILAASPDDEAAQRTAINRAYYALFNVAKAHLVQEGTAIPPKGAAHELVWGSFQSAPRGARRLIAQISFRLLRLRHFADYEASYPGVGRVAATAVRRARQGAEAIRNLSESRIADSSGTVPCRAVYDAFQRTQMLAKDEK